VSVSIRAARSVFVRAMPAAMILHGRVRDVEALPAIRMTARIGRALKKAKKALSLLPAIRMIKDIIIRM
jgi:hypothetical protein